MNPKICLTMIVRNESKIIERCLDSAKDIIDYVVVCDTGSTDNTPEIVEKYLQDNSIPGKVYRQEWVNFGHNRTLSSDSAKNWLKENGHPLQDTFLLLLDADMLLVVNEDFNKSLLKDDAYQLVQKSHSLAHFNTRLIRASLPWKCVGVTHEYWASLTHSRDAKIDSLYIDDRNDGGCKSDKFERDVRLLTQGLKDEPNNARYMFYLANSYECLKQHQNAIEWYKKRIAAGGWDEEMWYSMYMIGRCHQEMGEWDKALNSYLEAYQFKPTRSETIYQISNYYRNKQQYQLAYLFAKLGTTIPYPSSQVLFISHPVYNYLFDEDLSIAAFYTPHRDEGFNAANRLVLNKDAPWHIKDQAYKNILFYVQKLENADYQPIAINPPPIQEGFSAHYNPMNPTIQKTDDGYDMICRTVNYMQIGAKHFQSLDIFDPTNTVKTRNYFVKYDKNMNKVSQYEIVESLPRIKLKSRNIEGLEDCRLFKYRNANWFTCTTLDTNPCGQPQISLCKLAEDTESSEMTVETMIPFLGPDPRRCEKNWLPLLKDGDLHMIYSYDPFIVYKPHVDGEFSIIKKDLMSHHIVPKHDFSRFSGSAPPIEFDDGHLMLVHETVYEGQRIYLHRFVYLDSDLHITKVSKPFIFLHQGIEYCCGIATNHSDTKLLMTIGIEDREAYICSVDLGTVRTMLEPLP